MSRVVRKITKPVAKVFDKIIPNEIKPALPYIAAVAPFIIPPQFAFASQGIFSNPAVSRAILSGGLNLGSQLAQEGSEGDFNPFGVAMAGATGYLSTPGATKGLQTSQQIAGGKLDQLVASGADIDAISAASEAAAAPRSFLTQAKDFGITATQKANELLSAPIQPGGPGLFSKAGIKAASVPLTSQATMDAMAYAKQAQLDYEAELAEYNKFVEDQNLAKVANDEDRARAIYNSMINAGAFTADTIKDTLDQLNLPSGFFAYGGRVRKAEGGIMDLGGREMDMRAGGFIPIGAKEKADDVPARLSKNEFVMTADAVRGAGGGNINLGAKRMYDTMNKLEARGRA
tara:strand:+ start:812 stop:1846 length:1035 start_codon:yes stop_codon:yes gene_type:complete